MRPADRTGGCGESRDGVCHMHVDPKWLVAGYRTDVAAFENSGERCFCNLPTHDVEELFQKKKKNHLRDATIQ